MFEKTILSRLAKAEIQFSGRNAFFINGNFHTYGELWNLIGKIRTQLQDIKIANAKVGLVAHDDLHTYASIFAVWMEGMAYVPLHPKHPMERNLGVISQAELQWVLDSRTDFEFESVNIVGTKACQSLPPTTGITTAGDDTLAYILFTSGSTGKPKGVPITRGNLVAFITAFLGTDILLDENDRCLQCFDLTFDISVQCYLVPLLLGACVYTIPHDQIKFTYVYALLNDHQLTFAVLTPSMIQHLRPYFEEIYLEKLKYCLLSGEAVPVDLLMEWFKHIPHARVFNFYGPTEATIYCAFYEAKRHEPLKEANGILSIGQAFEAIDALVLDQNLQRVGIGVKGEMYVSGDQVASGYWKNPEMSAQAFTMLKYKGDQRRFYKTGDICSKDGAGDILYYGRLDCQVKIQGYRIELGEIEFYAREAIAGRNVVAFVHTGQKGRQQIALCLETERFDQQAVLDFLRTKLPAYMLPSRVFNLERFPLNTSDKVDRKKIENLLPA